jgi:hypothetical protein
VLVVGVDQLLAHLRLLCVVRSAEGDMMHRTASLVPSRNSRSFVDVDHAAFRIARRGEADNRSFAGTGWGRVNAALSIPASPLRPSAQST